jgi:hypothetical protein
MEIIKKTILQVLTTGHTTGGTIIIPDTGVTYAIKILLTQPAIDIGFFDAYGTGKTIQASSTSMIVTGASSSRLSELRKYTITNVFADQYFGGGSLTVDGVDYTTSIPNVTVVYYIGGIRYTDYLSGVTSGLTIYRFVPQGTGSTANFINAPYYKNPNKENIVSNPKINDDVFIVRQELSAFDSNYRLEYMKSLNDLETYAGGNFFNIVNNS